MREFLIQKFQVFCTLALGLWPRKVYSCKIFFGGSSRGSLSLPRYLYEIEEQVKEAVHKLQRVIANEAEVTQCTLISNKNNPVERVGRRNLDLSVAFGVRPKRGCTKSSYRRPGGHRI